MIDLQWERYLLWVHEKYAQVISRTCHHVKRLYGGHEFDIRMCKGIVIVVNTTENIFYLLYQ